MRRLVLAGAAVAAGLLAALPATAGTGVTFTINPGTLSITEPTTTASLGTAGASLTATTLSGTLGSTTISDTRGGLAGWTLSIAGPSSFSDGNGHTLPASVASVYLATPPTTSGTVLVTNLHVAAATALQLTSSAQAFMTATGVLGTNSATYNPTVEIAVPTTAVAGTYTGTITQTVA